MKTKKQNVVAFATKAEAEAEVAKINVAKGYPRTEQGTRIGGGRHVETITTTTDDEPIEIVGGTWGVAADRLTAAGIDAKEAKEEDVILSKANDVLDPSTASAGVLRRQDLLPPAPAC
jgi:hypothetical protein